MLEVAASLEVADRIGGEPMPFDKLARQCGAHPTALLQLCRALAAFGVFSVDGDGNVGHTEKSRWLKSSAIPTLHHAARYWGMPSTWSAWGHLEYAIRTGKAPFEDVFGMPNFDYLGAHPQEAGLFDAFMQNSPDDRHAAVAQAYDFSGARVVVDVGGGNGALLRAILGAHPDVRGVLFDQESVVSGALLDGFVQRCAIDPGNFFERVSLGGDIYTLSQILHDWSDERCLQILRNCHAAMNDSGRILVIERHSRYGARPDQPDQLPGRYAHDGDVSRRKRANTGRVLAALYQGWFYRAASNPDAVRLLRARNTQGGMMRRDLVPRLDPFRLRDGSVPGSLKSSRHGPQCDRVAGGIGHSTGHRPPARCYKALKVAGHPSDGANQQATSDHFSIVAHSKCSI